MGSGKKAMTKSSIAKAIGEQCELKQSVASKLLDSLAGVAAKEVSKTGVFAIPGLCRLKTRMKPAQKAGKREMFGQVVMVKARPAKKNCQGFPSCGTEVEHLSTCCVLHQALTSFPWAGHGKAAAG